jgi:tetrahydromethanopterin S-methyltransferase subunit G
VTTDRLPGMATRPHDDPPPASRAQRSLAVMAGTVIGLCVVDIAVLLIARGAGVPDSAFHSGVLSIVQVLPLPGLVIGLLLALSVIAVGVVARTRGR